MKVLAIALAGILIFSATSNVSAQRRDYMTEPEIELVRDSQDIDKRIEVLTKMIDRRFTAIGADSGGWKAGSKDLKSWGEAPTGTRSQLLSDIRQLIQKAIDDIDDVSEHNSNTLTQNKTEGLLFPAAVRSLAAAANRYKPVLSSELPKTNDDREKGIIINAIELCDAIIDSLVNLPPEVKSEKKKKT